MTSQPSAKLRSLLTAVALLAWAFLPTGSGNAQSGYQSGLAGVPTPETTVIITNATDGRFSRDFSPLLKHLRLPWVIVDSVAVPAAVKDKNLIILGRLDDSHTGAIMRQLLAEDELETIRGSADKPHVLTKENPWTPERSVTICTGSSLMLTRDAAEQAVRALIANTPPASAWIQTAFDGPLDDALRAHVEQLRFTWDDEELPLVELLIDAGARPRLLISTVDAAEDVERLFNLFAHGYAGYAFFNQHGEFATAKARILEELSTRSNWTTAAFANLLREQLSFITDCHLRIGEHQFAGHADFWYDTTLELTPGNAGFSFVLDGETYTLLSINGANPEAHLFPSLNGQGAPVYRLGLLAEEPPAPLSLLATEGVRERRFEISLRRSDYDYYAEEIFREDYVGGVPVIRVRSFGDVREEDLARFVETGQRLRGEPVVVVDIRGNGGGNESWFVSWIMGLTGRRAEAVFISSELTSKTTMAGRANLFAHLAENYPEIGSFSADARRHTNIAEAFESRTRQPAWTGPHYPAVPLLANDTTLVIVFNGLVASAGEGMVMRASQAENVILVGENSRGCLTFGNISNHQLPHSRLPLQFPINFSVFLDGHFREGEGLAPDLWVPAADAVNYAVAAVRNGTITTEQPLSPATLQQPFESSDPWARVRRERIIHALMIGLLTAAGSVWAYFMRRRPRVLATVGIVWLAIGSVWLLQERFIGLAFLLVGAICLVWGTTILFRARWAPERTPG